MEGSREALRIGFCDSVAAKYACKHWHYSGAIPTGAVVRFGVWEDDAFIGAVLYTKGAGMTTYRALNYGLERVEACELARVALRSHRAPVTQILSKTLKQLQVVNPGLRLVISYADPRYGHVGTVYQAGNWIYVGLSKATLEFWLGGKWVHERSVYSGKRQAFRNNEAEKWDEWLKTLTKRYQPPKHIYLWPFDRQVRRAITKDALPYPSAEQVSEARRHPSGVEG